MKKLKKLDFLEINRRMNGNCNGGESYAGPTKKITKGEELEVARRFQRTTKCKSR